jgi:hypothetical protein
VMTILNVAEVGEGIVLHSIEEHEVTGSQRGFNVGMIFVKSVLLV